MAVGPRGSYHMNVGVAAGASKSDAVNTSMWESASIQAPTAITNARIVYQVTNNQDSNGDPTGWKAAVTPTGTAVAAISVATGETYRVPDDVMAARYFRLFPGGTAQAAARTFKLTLKS